MISAEFIEAETSRYLRAVVEASSRRLSAAKFYGLACDIDPGVGSLYVHVADIPVTEEDAVEDWPHTFVERECDFGQPPGWFDEFNELVTDYFVRDVGEYDAIENALETILSGVSGALGALWRDGFLSSMRFVDAPVLSVVTEDDDDGSVGLARVTTGPHPPKGD